MKTKRSKKRWAWTTENRRKHTPARYWDSKAMTVYNEFAHTFEKSNRRQENMNCKLVVNSNDPDSIDWTPRHSPGDAWWYFFLNIFKKVIRCITFLVYL